MNNEVKAAFDFSGAAPPVSGQWKDLFSRTELLLGSDGLRALSDLKVIIFGLGGVGSWCAEALVRSGVRRLTIVDSDLICVTNVNRQAQATVKNIGKPKADELKSMLLDINPEAEIEAVKLFYDAESAGQFDLKTYDFAVDAIDTLKCKILLLKNCAAAGVRVFSSMGAASKLDPSMIRTGPVSKTRQCPLARAVRKRLREEGVKEDFICVYSEEPPVENKGRSGCGKTGCACPDPEEKNLCLMKAKINGSMAHVTAPFGFALAGLVIRAALGEKA